MEFYFIENQSHLLHMIIQTIYLSVIAALHYVSFDVEITHIKTTKR